MTETLRISPPGLFPNIEGNISGSGNPSSISGQPSSNINNPFPFNVPQTSSPLVNPFGVTQVEQSPLNQPTVPFGTTPFNQPTVPFQQIPFGATPFGTTSFEQSTVPFGTTPFEQSTVPFGQPNLPFEQSTVPFGQPNLPFQQIPFGTTQVGQSSFDPSSFNITSFEPSPFEQPTSSLEQQFEMQNITTSIAKINISDMFEDLPDVMSFIEEQKVEIQSIKKEERRDFSPKRVVQKVTPQRSISKSKFQQEIEKYNDEQLRFLKLQTSFKEREAIFDFLLPVRCITCNKVIGRYQTKYDTLISLGKTPDEAMNILDIHGCCRKHVISQAVTAVGAPMRKLKYTEKGDIVPDAEDKDTSLLAGIRSISLAEYRDLKYRDRERINKNIGPLRIVNSMGFTPKTKVDNSHEVLEELLETAGEYPEEVYLGGGEQIEKYIPDNISIIGESMSIATPFGLDTQAEVINPSAKVFRIVPREEKETVIPPVPSEAASLEIPILLEQTFGRKQAPIIKQIPQQFVPPQSQQATFPQQPQFAPQQSTFSQQPTFPQQPTFQ